MGVLNATPDSFSDAGELTTLDRRVARAHALVAEGADILDVGGAPAGGGRPPVTPEEELERVIPIIEAVAAAHDVLISVDTHVPEVAGAALAAGAEMVNDVSGLRYPELAGVCARAGAALVLLHTRVEPLGTLLDPAAYDDVVEDVGTFLLERMGVALAQGLEPDQIVLDPGPDFAKTPAQTVAILRRLDALHVLGRPVLLAVSRKDFLGAVTGRPVHERAAGTLAALGEGIDAGAQILRVHDVAAAADFLAVRSVLRGEHELAPDAGLTPERYPAL